MSSAAPTGQQTPVLEGGPVSAVVVLAAGEGKRMRSSRSKLLHEIAGHSMLSYALDAATALEPEHIVVVVGHLREQVEAHLAEIAPHATTVVQTEQRGTGHAVQVALEALPELRGDVLVTYGDVPMLTAETLAALVAGHRTAGTAVSVLTAHVDDPTGYGRIVRGAGDEVLGIVEDRDASEAQRTIHEINSGIYVFEPEALREGLARLRPTNDQGELYLTDVLGFAREAGRAVGAYAIEDRWQTEGVNDRVQLARMNAEVNRRTLERWMRAGVTVVDPASTWVHASVDLAEDVTLLPGTSLEGATSVAAGATIGPDTTLVDVEVGEGASVVRTHGSLAVIGAGASVGPFAYLRPGTVLGERGKIGTFVETKNARIGDRAKVPHLTYAGDVEIGEDANIGAGVIFANYDGVTKSSSRVGRASFVGSDSTVVAPVTVADGAYVGAGSTVTGDVGPGELAVSRARQRNVPGWVARKRSGSKTAAAAEEALAAAGPADRAPGADGPVDPPEVEQHVVPAPLSDQEVVGVDPPTSTPSTSTPSSTDSERES
ncbi:bifunctional UDP-N-acetylglucosamine diphosphorylase/glucosamine-1-phosphate N-acetyltransferase GlmU [Microlunatus flavus]|uniref:Bifunctional protein GlmU n=1 Tax=Microlunatus flavus TaxID=1036181 RepID=A0A1H9K468_9ACTN|nr:bifunctional UDP-N-acetylglucosamine diphosphorylase/glucosamine-1-phosphate N-acetyltransferase GlmU [Microlunatus flavus]SEQ93890.1 bifunctional UDP-N-acetylglucosamine pyrophosphorylase / Glucosamine-1-phosphate N-acetyltransferase [Microlunatus flavus]